MMAAKLGCCRWRWRVRECSDYEYILYIISAECLDGLTMRFDRKKKGCLQYFWPEHLKRWRCHHLRWKGCGWNMFGEEETRSLFCAIWVENSIRNSNGNVKKLIIYNIKTVQERIWVWIYNDGTLYCIDGI